MNMSLEERLNALSQTSKGLAFIQEMIDRGDFIGPEKIQAQAWLKREIKLRLKAYMQTPDGAAIRQAKAAERAVWISIAALAVSAMALFKSW